MKTILENLIHSGYPIKLKQEMINYCLLNGESETTKKFHTTRSTINRLMIFKNEILSLTNDDIQKIEESKEKRIRSKEYRLKYKSRHNPGIKRKKHPFKVISQYANSNYKLVKFRMKQLVSDSDNLVPFQLWKLAKKQKCLCAISGIKLTPENVSIDHIIPVSQGGTNDISNIRLVHAKVNKMRNDYSMEEFLDLCKTIYLNNILRFKS